MGCLIQKWTTKAEIIPLEPDPGNTGVGNDKGIIPASLVSSVTRFLR